MFSGKLAAFTCLAFAFFAAVCAGENEPSINKYAYFDMEIGDKARDQ